LEIVLVGNTAMHHLFLGFPVKQLGVSPFVSLTDKPIDIKARDLGIGIATGGYIYLPPPIAGFVGSDHLAMLVATNISEMKGNYLGIDIGTNTEIVLKSNKGLESVSTASGPAFEGAHIRFGMRAASGAIERVIINPKTCIPEIQTINDKKPVGICGSGILDSVAELLKAGIINRRGRFNAESECVYKDSKGIVQYILDPESKISINQNDIVEIQLAKSAIRSGIDILLENAGVSFEDLDKIIIAGAFGSYIDPKNVVNIGMFPNVSLKKIIQVGNAAAVGAKMMLLSKKIRKGAEVIAEKTKYLELTVFPTFADHFAKSTLFPEIEEII
ncbi:MAG: ASKHA domain-containing protein, partial [Actinobacteria bacterium]|nr:ASKHA domain-containing protein [Actinomycetota bacterium]